MVIKLFLKGNRERLVNFLLSLNENMLLSVIDAFGYSCLQIFVGPNNSVDGCATFFRRDRFSHVKKYEVTKLPSV